MSAVVVVSGFGAQIGSADPGADQASAIAGAAAPGNDALAVRLTLAPEGNVARYRVREQLAGFDLPSDAVGETTSIQGSMMLGDDGSIVAEESRFAIDLTTLATDQRMRDGYVRRNTLETADHPTAELAPTAIQGLSMPLPTSGEHTFQIVADLTVRGVTRSTTWEVTATFNDNAITGLAQTQFTFEEFQINKPSVARVLSVADEIRLEYQFNLVAAAVDR